jgi:phage terminase large subunit
MFKKTTAQQKIAQLRSRIRIVQGGTSSSKTFSIIPLLITYACQVPKSEISIVSESIPHLKRGAIRDFIKIMEWTYNFNHNNWNKSSLTYTFSNGSIIEFFSADQPDKLRGARRDVLFINEANNIDFESYQQLSIRTRKFIYLDYNPTQEFWVHTQLINDGNSDFIILTYKDNEALEKTLVKEIESAKEKAKTSSYWANWWKVYGLGEVGSLEGVIFNNWQQIDTIPNEARLIGLGLDFGYTNDPTAIVEVYQYNDKRILNELCYRTGMVNKDIVDVLPNNVIIYADSAEPKSIEEIRRHGKMIKAVTKGKDSIMYGIQIMQSQNYLVTKQSVNIIKELRGYTWDTDKNGVKLNKPIDYLNHSIDSIRYHEMETLGLNKNFGKYSVY